MTAPPKVMVVFGTRPEAIKLVSVIRELDANPYLDLVSVSTDQHRELLGQVINTFNLPTHYHLNVMSKAQLLSRVSSRIMDGIDHVLEMEQPDFVVVQGDTTTAFIAALVSFYRRIPIGHVEAGLRTFDRNNPFPEETNRILISKLASLHFAPTVRSHQNLVQEGIPMDSIFWTGNTVIDALQVELEAQKTDEVKRYINSVLNLYGLPSDWKTRRFVLVTAHRRESFGVGIESICSALLTLADRFRDVLFVFPVHPNPHVQDLVKERLSGISNIKLTPPLEYRDFTAMLQHCYMVLTDSGGVQEEAPALGKPVLVMRETTERPEGVECGVVRLVGTDQDRIVAETSELLSNEESYQAMSKAAHPYGNGNAGEKIVRRIHQYLTENQWSPS